MHNSCKKNLKLRACLHGGGVRQVGEVTRLDGVTRLSIQSLILIWSRLQDEWDDPPHVTSPLFGPPPSCKQALIWLFNSYNALTLKVKGITILLRMNIELVFRGETQAPFYIFENKQGQNCF